MKSLHNKLIIYDSNCKVCSSMRNVMVKLTSIPEAKIKAYKDLADEVSRQVDANKFKNVMALVDTSGGKTLYGAEGVAYIFSTQYKMVDFFLSIRPVFRLFNFFYKTLAYNRYIIATPKSTFECACFPDRTLKYRISYIAMTLLLSVLLTVLFGLSLRNMFPDISFSGAAVQMLLMAGTGWVAQMLLAAILLKETALDYIGNLGSIMVAGLLILVPWMILHAATGLTNPYLPALSVLISSAYMLYLHIRRTVHLKLSHAWTLSWFLSLQCGAFFWIRFFHLK